MSNRNIHIDDGEAITTSGKGRLASPSAQHPPRVAEILEFQTARRLVGLEDASSPVEGFESIGLLAVRIVGQFELPRLMVMAVRKGEEP